MRMAKILAAMLLLPTLAMAEEVGGKDIIVSSVSLPANTVGLCAAARPKRINIRVSTVPNSDVCIGNSSLTSTGGYTVPYTAGGTETEISLNYQGTLYCVSSVPTTFHVLELF
jgi:hypothetical protein